MPYADTTPYIYLGSLVSGTQFTGTFSIKKISNFKNNPAVYFTIKFEEVYENASDVTVVTGTKYTQSLLFVPAEVRPGETFSNYYTDGATGKFLSRAEDGDALFKFGIGMELRYLYVTNQAYVRASLVVDAGTNTLNDIQNPGWGMMLCNNEGGYTYDPDAQDETIGFSLSAINLGGGIIYTVAVMIVDCETRCFPDMRCLSFIGALGEETVLFRGLHTETGLVDKTFYQNVNRVRRVLKAFKRTRMKLRSLIETQDVRRLLHELIYTETDVWMYDTDIAAGYKDVVVIDDDVIIGDRNERFDSTIDVEYYE
jgi:hypothetical protein